MKLNIKKMATNLYHIQSLIEDLHIYSLDNDKILSEIASKLYELKECDNGLYDATELIDNDKDYNNYINKLYLRDKIMNIRQETILRVDTQNELIVREEVIDEILKFLEE